MDDQARESLVFAPEDPDDMTGCLAELMRVSTVLIPYLADHDTDAVTVTWKSLAAHSDAFLFAALFSLTSAAMPVAMGTEGRTDGFFALEVVEDEEQQVKHQGIVASARFMTACGNGDDAIARGIFIAASDYPEEEAIEFMSSVVDGMMHLWMGVKMRMAARGCDVFGNSL